MFAALPVFAQAPVRYGTAPSAGQLAPQPEYSAGTAAGQTEARLGQLETELRRLNGVIEEQGFRITQLRDQLEKVQGDTEFRLNTLESGRSSPAFQQNTWGQSQQPAQPYTPPAGQDPNQWYGSAGSEMRTPPPSQGYNFPNNGPHIQPPVSGGSYTIDGATGAYDQAFQTIQSGDFVRAETLFRDFLSRYPDHKLAGNAKYWLGETFYVRGLYEDAARQFAEGYQTYPKSSKGPDNLLKLALSLSAINRVDDACVTLSQLTADYPNASSTIQGRADKERSRLKCGS